jgi:hypothetical protein
MMYYKNFIDYTKERFIYELQYKAIVKVFKDKEYPRNPYRSGFGRKIPTHYTLKCSDGRTRRVYCICFSNSGSLYVNIEKKMVFCENALDTALSLSVNKNL